MEAGGVAAGPVESFYKAVLQRVATAREYDRNGRSCSKRRPRRLGATRRGDHAHLPAHEFGGKGKESVVQRMPAKRRDS